MSNHYDRQPLSKRSSSYCNLNYFNYSSQPVQSLQSVIEHNWQIMSLEISSHGSTGVLFIQTSIGSFVLKMNNQAPANEFFNLLAALMDVNVPEIKVIGCYERFYEELAFKIEKFCQKDQALAARLRTRMDFPFYQLIQYIPSLTLLQIGRNRFQKYQLTQAKLQSIGICLGYDIMTNNSDRFKLTKIWPATNQGNISNILIKVPKHQTYDKTKVKDRQNTSIQLGQYYFIDHSGCLLDIQNNKLAMQNFNKYMDKVTLFHDMIIQFIRGQLPLSDHFEGLTKQIQLHTKYKLQQKDITHIIEGIIYSTTMFIDLISQNQMQKILIQLKREQKQQRLRPQIKYWNQYWNLDLARIKLKHLQIYNLKVSAVYLTYNEIIKGIGQKVAKNITQQKDRKNKRLLSSATNSEKSKEQSSPKKLNNSRLQGHSGKQDQKQFLKINVNINDKEKDKDIGKMMQKSGLNEDKQQPHQQEHQRVRVIPQGIGRSKLKQRLQAFQRKNYQKNNQNNTQE